MAPISQNVEILSSRVKYGFRLLQTRVIYQDLELRKNCVLHSTVLISFLDTQDTKFYMKGLMGEKQMGSKTRERCYS